MSGPTEAAGQHASQQQQQTSYLHPSAADSKQQASKRHQLSGSSAVEGLRAAMQLVHAQKQGDRNVKLRVKKLDKKTKEYIDGMLRRSQHRSWCLTHGKTLPPPRLHPVILRVIREWFDLVDDDGSGTLEHHELLAALQAARIPCDANSISEMIRLMDANKDGCIGWNEFEAFMMDEFAAGKHLLSGEYVLPSGMALPFGVMIRQLKRTQMLSEITEGGESRRKWMHYNIDLSADAAAIAQAEHAIRLQKAYDETLHNREVVNMDEVGFEPGSDVPSEWQGHPGPVPAAASARGTMSNNGGSSSSSGGNSSNASSSNGGNRSENGGFKGVRMPSWMVSNNGGSGNEQQTAVNSSSSGSTAAAEQQLMVTVVAGVPVVAPRAQSAVGHAAAPGSRQIGAEAAAAADGISSTGRSSSAKSARPMPAGVPRLQLSALNGSSCGRSSSGTTTRMQQQQQVSALPGVDSGSVLASARDSYWLTSAAAGASSQAGTARGSSRCSIRESIAEHLFRQAAAAGVPLDRPGTPSLPGTARLSSMPGSSSSNCGALSHRSSSRTQCITPGRQQQQQHRAGSPLHSIQPIPCQDTWGVAAASCLARSHSQQCESELHCSIGCTSPKAKSGLISHPAHRQDPTMDSTVNFNASCVGQRPKLSARESVLSLSQGIAGVGSSAGTGCYNCYSITGRSSSCSDMLSVSGGNIQMQPWQQQQQHEQEQPSSHGQGVTTLSSSGCSAAAAAVLAAAQQSDGNYREAGMTHLMSVRRTPPATLLSESYVGPITAAVAAAHTPRKLLNSLQGSTSDATSAAASYVTPRQQQQQRSSSGGGGNTHRTPRTGYSTTGATAAAAAAGSSGFFASSSGQAALAVAAGDLMQGGVSVPGVADVPGTAGKVLVATNNGGAVMTPRGDVITYVNTPRQAAAAAAGGGGGGSAAGAATVAAARMRSGPLATCIGLGLRQLDNAARVSCAITSKNKHNQKKSMKGDTSGSVAATGIGKAGAAVTASGVPHASNPASCSSGVTSVGKSCAKTVLVHSPRHGLLAQKLVKRHSVYGQNMENVKQQQQGAGRPIQDQHQASSSGDAAGSGEHRTTTVRFA